MEAVALGQVIKKCVDIAVEEGSFLYWWQDDVEWIKTQMSFLLSCMKDADSNPSKTEVLSNLRIIIRDLAHDVEDIMDTYFPRIVESQRRNKKFKCLCIWYTRRCFVKKVEGIRKRVESIKAIQTFGINVNGGVVSEGEEWDSRASVIRKDEPHHVIIGLDTHVEQLTAKLLNEDVNYDVVSIVGMPGVGKTTLARRVFNSAKSHFECSAMVYVSQKPNVTQVFLDIASQVRMDVERDKDLPLQLKDLQLQLIAFLKVKRYVILFDDIWERKAWNDLGSIIPNNSESGGRVIITSRIRDVGRCINGGNPLHELAPLNADDSWELFSSIVKNMNNHHHSTELKNIGRQILRRCGGVPLAIVVTAGLLVSKAMTVPGWTAVHGLMGQVDEEEDTKCLKVLALSYNELPLELKPCFLYFGLFPEDYEISAFRLINMWVAEKFIKANGDLSAEQVGEDYLSRLVSRNLIQVVSSRFDGSVRNCRIHDLLHALCIKLARETNFFDTCDGSSSHSATKVRRVTATNLDNYLSLDHQTPKLRAFLCFGSGGRNRGKKIAEKIKHCRFLRVLSVEFEGFVYRPSSIPLMSLNGQRWVYIRANSEFSCPSFSIMNHLRMESSNFLSEINNLIYLSYLRIKCASLIMIPATTVSNLKNLLTLDLRSAFIVILPTSIWKMKQLRHLFLPDRVLFYLTSFSFLHPSSFDVALDAINIDLPNLQTLYVGQRADMIGINRFTSLRKLNIGVESARTIEVLSSETPISHNLENLKLRGSYDASVTNFDLSRYSKLRKMKLVLKMTQFTAPNTFPPFLTNLTLGEGTTLEEDPVETLKKLRNLRVLKLKLRLYPREKLVCSGSWDNFPKLEVLHFQNMLQLMELIVEEGGMPMLNKITIKNCKYQITLPERLRNMANVEP